MTCVFRTERRRQRFHELPGRRAGARSCRHASPYDGKWPTAFSSPEEQSHRHRSSIPPLSLACYLAVARYASSCSKVPLQPCVMLLRFESKVCTSASVALWGAHWTVNFVLPPGTSSKVKVERISNGQLACPGWRVVPPFSSENDVMRTSRSGGMISR